ncbi:MAG TPA: hypothetical protein PLX06_07860 [Fimbriimonadaceae bacterium]|nr:hypothetical protein [Fimbriimonadaceae bacterium]
MGRALAAIVLASALLVVWMALLVASLWGFVQGQYFMAVTALVPMVWWWIRVRPESNRDRSDSFGT